MLKNLIKSKRFSSSNLLIIFNAKYNVAWIQEKKNGLNDGISLSFYCDNSLSVLCQYKNGMKNGIELVYLDKEWMFHRNLNNKPIENSYLSGKC